MSTELRGQCSDFATDGSVKLIMAWKWQKKTYLIYSIAAYLCFLLTIVGLSSSSWRKGVRGEALMQEGPLAFCKWWQNPTVYECGSVNFSKMSAVLEASTALSLGSVPLLFTVVPVACFLQLKDSKREDIVLFTIFGLFTAVLGVIGAILYAVDDGNGGGDLSWGFAVFVTGMVGAIVSFLLLCMLSCAAPSRSRRKVKPHKT